MKKIAIVGLGRISQRHIEAIQSCPELKIVTVCDIDNNKAEKLAEKLSCNYCSDIKHLANNNSIDIVSVCTPSGLHPEHCKQIAQVSSAPIIICEKPISLTVREALNLKKTLDETNKRFIPVYQNRQNPNVKFIKELIVKGDLGKLFQFSCNVFWNRNEDYFENSWHGTQIYCGGAIFTQASHYVDLIRHLFGEVQEYKGFSSFFKQKECHDTISSIMKFKNDMIGTLNATICVAHKNYNTEFTLIAEKGTIKLSGTNLNKIEFWDVENIPKPNTEHELTHIYGNGHNIIYDLINKEKWDEFPLFEEVLDGIRLMEKISI